MAVATIAPRAGTEADGLSVFAAGFAAALSSTTGSVGCSTGASTVGSVVVSSIWSVSLTGAPLNY